MASELQNAVCTVIEFLIELRISYNVLNKHVRILNCLYKLWDYCLLRCYKIKKPKLMFQLAVLWLIPPEIMIIMITMLYIIYAHNYINPWYQNNSSMVLMQTCMQSVRVSHKLITSISPTYPKRNNNFMILLNLTPSNLIGTHQNIFARSWLFN